ncbi:MAG TPA: thiamine phosphate synthase [Bryobacteraceae bacterium]|jgi:thiamine-phosphate pyrophosphorylase|nr:thiamine phosphate synthase [Bryobacteraceae bacterium]
MRLVLPRLYVILDAALIPSPERDCAASLAEAGVRLLQYRNKSVSARQYLESSRELAETLVPRGVSFFVNDRPDVAFLAGASGVHVGQEDLDVEQTRRVVGRDRLVGVSTHNLEQFDCAATSSADYIAVGPIFGTSSKANPDPVVGLAFLRRVRGLTEKPIVAIGGITLERAAGAIEAGADSVAVISGILSAADPAQRARQYITTLEAAKHAAAF